MSANAGIPQSPPQQFGALLWRLLSGRQWDRALEVARDWLSIDPENPDAHLAAAQALVNLGQYPAAETHVAKVLAARPNHGFALRLASIACFHQEKTEKADEHIRRAIELQPNDAMHWYHLALMRYRQGLPDAAEKHAKRSLELKPDNADTINLIAICQRGNPRGQLQQYLRALEIDPENSIVHTNLGAYYLNSARDFPAAEASFRRALQCDPANRVAQQNLFAVLRLRDPVYRVLTLPRNLLRRVSWSRQGHTGLARIGLVLLWLSLGRYLWGVFAIWLLLVWPVIKAYESLTLSDIRAKAGVAGARRGGWRGFHRWPLEARLAIFALLVTGFWGGLFWLYESRVLPLESVILVGTVALLVWFSLRFKGWWKRTRSRWAAKSAEKKFRQQVNRAGPSPADPY